MRIDEHWKSFMRGLACGVLCMCIGLRIKAGEYGPALVSIAVVAFFAASNTRNKY